MKANKRIAALLLMVTALSANVMTAATPMAKNSPSVKNSLMSKKPKKGKIVKESYNEKLGYKDLELSNGVHVLIKPTDSENGEILMSARQRGGKSLYGKEDWANCEMFNYVLGDYRMGNWDTSSDNKQVEIFQSMDIDFDHVHGSATVKDLETLFQLTYLQFSGIIPRDEDRFKKALNNYETTLREEAREDHDATFVFLDSIGSVLHNHNWRDKSLKADDLTQVNYDRILEIAKERTANAAGYTFVFTGAFDESNIRPLIERYIASLPADKSVKPNWVNVATYPQGETVCHFKSKMETPITKINIRWINTQIPYSSENSLKAQFLSNYLKTKIYWSKMGENVGVIGRVGGNEQHYMEGDMTFTEVHSFVDVKPEFADEAIRMLKEEMLRTCGYIDAASLDELKKEELEWHKNRPVRDDCWYWSNAIMEYAMNGIEYTTDYEQELNAITPESISAFARQLLATGNRIEIVMSPAE